jgi:hypothetical protein
MTLAVEEQRRLARIEGALRRSDPKLTAMLSMFNRLTRSEAMPRQEFLSSAGRGPWPLGQPGPPARPDHLMRLHRPASFGRPVRLGGPARLAGPRRLGQSRVPGRIVAILTLVMAMCVLGLTVVLFSALSHVGSGSATPGPAASCHSVMLAGCQSGAPTPLK